MKAAAVVIGAVKAAAIVTITVSAAVSAGSAAATAAVAMPLPPLEVPHTLPRQLLCGLERPRH